MKKRTSPLLTLLFLPVLALCILAMAISAYYLVSVPQRATEQFGTPSSSLTTWEVYMLSMRLLRETEGLQNPFMPGSDPVRFTVELGEPAASVIQRLENQGLIPSADALRLYLQYTGLDTTLQAGEFKLSPAMTPIEIAQALQDPTPEEVLFTILPGWRLEEIAAALNYTGLNISAKAFVSAAQRTPTQYSFTRQFPAIATMEGFLFPGEYELPRDLNAPQLLAIFLTRFDTGVSAELRQAIELQGLTLFEAVTLASIAQREAVVIDELPEITAVYLNRLRSGMKLEADPTVQYAVGFNLAQNTWWTNPLSLQDLAFDSLYNTYVYPGLPPGPIANPGLEALQAVAYPEESPYYYFRARCDGSGLHVFAVTFQEHVNNACTSQP